MFKVIKVTRGLKSQLKILIVFFDKNGFYLTFHKVIQYIRYNLIDKWKFVYFELDLKLQPFSLPERNSSLKIRKADYKDIKKIKNELYPCMGDKQEFDKRYIDQIGKKGINCFIAELDNELVHYFMVFDSAIHSPLMRTPIDHKKIFKSDVYLGNAFTVMGTRGQSITTYVLQAIIKYLQSEEQYSRAVLLIHKDTPGAVGFYKRLGFKVIANAEAKTLVSKFFVRN